MSSQPPRSGTQKPPSERPPPGGRRPNLERRHDVAKKKKGKKDACYHKVKAKAKVFPSAYASGRIVQCRKVGAANYGNKSKKRK